MTTNTNISKLAERLYDLIDPWDRDYKDINEIADDIKTDPETVIAYLLDVIEER